MNADELIALEPAVVGSDHHSKAVVDEVVDDGAAMADVALESLGRRRVRSNRLNNDKAEPATVLPSFIWDYFVKDASGKFVICTLCPAQTTRFAYSGGTSTMNRHLPGTEFDPAGFVTLPGSTTTNTSGPLQFPAGFELSDAGIEMAGVGLDQRFFDYSTLTGASTTGRGRRHSSSISGNSSGVSSANSAANQKILTHRLLKYLIAQYEPLDVSHMGAELSMLLFGGSTEWPTPGLNFGYGFGGGMGGNVPKLPTEDTIKLALANLYYSQREILKEVMADVEVLSLSLNNWTSAFGQNVLTVSGHWISRGFRRRDCVLEVYVLPLDERVNTIALLRDVMDKWEIPSAKVAALTMRPHTPTTSTVQEEDSDSSRTVAQAQAEAEAEASTIHSEYPGLAVVRCFAEELEGAVAGGLCECADLTRRCRNYVSYFIQNPSEYQIFLALQRSMGEEASAASASAQTASIVATADGVSVSIAEGGNATLGDEIDGDKEGQNADTTTDDGGAQSENANTTPPTPGSNSSSGEALPVICDFDDRWNSTTQMMCRIVELEPMLLRYKTGLESDTNPARRPMQLRFVCCELSPEEWASLKQLARLLEPIEGLVHVSPLAYPGVNDKDDSVDVQHHGPVTGENPTEEQKKLDQSAKTPVTSVSAANKKTAALLHEFFPLDEPATELDKLKTQVQQYLDSPSLPATDETEHDPLEWWSRYQRLFPSLARLAKKYLCISAVSTPFQEAFTNYGQLMREKKARLDIEVAAQVLFCRSVSRIPEMERIGV
eukprot:jgi/Phyca11/534582/estExt2_fgenesh1_pg.C_PHYCAscaffold_250086